MDELNNLFLSEGAFLPKFSVDLTGYDFPSPLEAIVSSDIKPDEAAKIAEWTVENCGSDPVFLAILDANGDKRAAIFRRLIEKGLWSRELLCLKIAWILASIDDVVAFADGLARSNEFDTLLLACMGADRYRSQEIVQNLARNGFLTQMGVIMKGGGINVATAVEDAWNESFFTEETDVSVMLYRPAKKAA
jgi:hypothetical protein